MLVLATSTLVIETREKTIETVETTGEGRNGEEGQSEYLNLA